MSGTNFFDFREKITARRGKTPAAAPLTSAPQVPSQTAAHSREVLSVSQLTHIIEHALQIGVPPTVHVHGEVSNVNLQRSSGHLYFTLKDADSCIDCIMWKSDRARLKFDLLDGHEVLVTGGIQVYGVKGRYQIGVRKIEPMGKGALELAFRQLYDKLEKQGLFAAERKKPLPVFPLRIAMVTSRNTAALQDMLKVFRRFAFLKLMLFDVPVQGDGAAERIASALRALGRQAERDPGFIDAIVLARGGGSIEDLWEFNEEIVARAIVASRVPVVTGIGHEIDTSIADLVADHHAHTPTEAAQVVTANWRTAPESLDAARLRLRRGVRSLVQEARQRLELAAREGFFRRPTDRVNHLRQQLDDRERSLQLAMGHRVRALRRRIEGLDDRLRLRHPHAVIARLRARFVDFDRRLVRGTETIVRRGGEEVSRLAALLIKCHPQHEMAIIRERLGQVEHRMNLAMSGALQRQTMRVEALSAQLQAVSPTAVLKRGYSITTLKRGGAVVRSTSDVKPGAKIITRLTDGQIESIVDDKNQPRLFE
jgi:exodeoxyribonuclease VII large subunit